MRAMRAAAALMWANSMASGCGIRGHGQMGSTEVRTIQGVPRFGVVLPVRATHALMADYIARNRIHDSP